MVRPVISYFFSSKAYSFFQGYYRKYWFSIEGVRPSNPLLVFWEKKCTAFLFLDFTRDLLVSSFTTIVNLLTLFNCNIDLYTSTCGTCCEVIQLLPGCKSALCLSLIKCTNNSQEEHELPSRSNSSGRSRPLPLPAFSHKEWPLLLHNVSWLLFSYVLSTCFPSRLLCFFGDEQRAKV